MTAVELTKTYLLANLLLLASYLLQGALTRLAGMTGLKASYRQLIAVSQVLIFASILAPPALNAVPRQHFPALTWTVFHPVSEDGGPRGESGRKTTAPRARASEKRLEPVGKPSRAREAFQWLAANASVADIFLCIVFTGSVALLLRLFRNTLRLRSLLRSAVPIRVLGRVRVVAADTLAIPFSVRLGRTSWVAVPTPMIGNGRDFRIALRHELQHHRQGDTLWAMVIEILVCVLFLNPVVFFWKRRIMELQEFSCDEALIGRKGISSRDYGSCLVRVAETALGVRQMYAGTTYMAADSRNPVHFKSFLRRRIEMLVSHEKRQACGWAGRLLGTIATIFTVILAFGAEQALMGDGQKEANPGKVVVDPAIQRIAEKALDEAVRAQKAKGGFAIVADPNTGKVLAVANIDSEKKKQGHWALAQVLEPASFAKALVAAQAIEAGLTSPQESHSCENGKYRYGGRTYYDWKSKGWARLSTEETVANSSDICSMKIAEKIGAEGLRKMLVNFGFGPDGTAKSFPEARTGTLPPNGNSLWPDLIPSVSAGFGFHATPLELVQAYGAIANGGNLLIPRPADASDSQTQVVRRVLSPENAEKMKEILRQVVLKGTAKGRASSDLYSTAGKTASSYVPDLTQYDLVEGRKKGNFAGFIGFAPVREPRVEVYVGIHEPRDGKGGAHGSEHAAPVFRRIAEEVLKHMKVTPDQPRA